MFVTLAWLVLNVQYIIVYGTDTSLNQQVAIAMLGVIAAIIGSYVFGAVWEDNHTRQIQAEYPMPPPPNDEGEV
jgi:H+/Cl- antiporter ClcA